MKIFAINLKTRDDRLDLLQKTLLLHGFSWKITNVPMVDGKSMIPVSLFQQNTGTHTVEILRFERHPSGGVFGCFDSHYSVMKGASLHLPNSETIMILEDDVQFTHHFSKNLLAHMDDQLHHNVADLGTLGIIGFIQGNPLHSLSLLTTKHFRGTHAYLLTVPKSREFVEFCDKTLQRQFKYSVDATLEIFFSQKLVTKPFAAVQAQSVSDTTWISWFPLLNQLSNTKYRDLMFSLPLLPIINIITSQKRHQIKKLVDAHKRQFVIVEK